MPPAPAAHILALRTGARPHLSVAPAGFLHHPGLPRLGVAHRLDTMSNKEKILAVIQNLPEEASIDEAIDRLYLLWKIERGLEQADAGEVTDHDEFMKEILNGED